MTFKDEISRASMSNNRGIRRSKPPNIVEWIDESPAKIMRNAWLRTRREVNDDHHRLRRILRIRNELLSTCTGKIPPGAFRRQKSGKPIPPWLIEPGHMSQYPVAEQKYELFVAALREGQGEERRLRHELLT